MGNDKKEKDKKAHKKQKKRELDPVIESESDNASDDEHRKKKSRSAVPQPLVIAPSDFGGSAAPVVHAGKASQLVVADEGSTLEEKLEALAKSISSKSGSGSGGPGDAMAPSSDSLVVLIEQALQSGDDVLLEQCLACDDDSIIDTTTRNMPTVRVFPFIRRLISKFEKRPSRGLLLTRWLSAVLKYHASYLISIPDLSRQFAGVSQIVEQRLASYSRLASLSGRLDLLMAHVSARGGSGATAVDSLESKKPRVVYSER